MAKSILQKAIEELQVLAAKQGEEIFVYPEFGDNRSYRLTTLEPYLDLLIVHYESAGEQFALETPKLQDFAFSKSRLELRMVDIDGEGLLLVAE
jgi:hypothetical protein